MFLRIDLYRIQKIRAMSTDHGMYPQLFVKQNDYFCKHELPGRVQMILWLIKYYGPIA